MDSEVSEEESLPEESVTADDQGQQPITQPPDMPASTNDSEQEATPEQNDADQIPQG